MPFAYAVLSRALNVARERSMKYTAPDSCAPGRPSTEGMIRDAQSRRIRVFVGTLLPEDRCGCRAFDFVDGRDDIAAANAQIRGVAASEGAVLVDLYPGFAGQTAALLTFDGLHPNETGYSRMAEIFFGAIRQQLETVPKQGNGSSESSH